MALATHWQLRRWLVVSSCGFLDGRWQKGLGGVNIGLASNMKDCGTGVQPGGGTGVRHSFRL